MKKILIVILVFFGLVNYCIAQKEEKKLSSEDSSITKSKSYAYIKANFGKLSLFDNSSPTFKNDNDFGYNYSFGFVMPNDSDRTIYFGLEYGRFNAKMTNNDKTIGQNEKYDFNGGVVKILFQYPFLKNLNFQYNIGIGSIECSRPWLKLPANLSTNGKQIEEYASKISNNCFVMGVSANLKLLDWLMLNANFDYIGATFNFTDVAHSENKLVTKVYNPDLILRAYYISIGIVFCTISN